jgi:hypothetical protein
MWPKKQKRIRFAWSLFILLYLIPNVQKEIARISYVSFTCSNLIYLLFIYFLTYLLINGSLKKCCRFLKLCRIEWQDDKGKINHKATVMACTVAVFVWIEVGKPGQNCLHPNPNSTMHQPNKIQRYYRWNLFARCVFLVTDFRIYV